MALNIAQQWADCSDQYTTNIYHHYSIYAVWHWSKSACGWKSMLLIHVSIFCLFNRIIFQQKKIQSFIWQNIFIIAQKIPLLDKSRISDLRVREPKQPTRNDIKVKYDFVYCVVEYQRTADCTTAKMKMSKIIRCCVFVVISLILTICVNGDGECEQLLQVNNFNIFSFKLKISWRQIIS